MVALQPVLDPGCAKCILRLSAFDFRHAAGGVGGALGAHADAGMGITIKTIKFNASADHYAGHYDVVKMIIGNFDSRHSAEGVGRAVPPE
jgi:hypothetical protein